MHRIYRDFTYESLSTEVNTPALQALAQRKGVCQDFAHIFVACLRSLGLAARYVSGYLLTTPAPGTVKLRGSDASHAWASVYLPGQPASANSAAIPACWVDLDPTNDRAGWPSPGEDYVTLAIGRDFSYSNRTAMRTPPKPKPKPKRHRKPKPKPRVKVKVRASLPRLVSPSPRRARAA